MRQDSLWHTTVRKGLIKKKKRQVKRVNGANTLQILREVAAELSIRNTNVKAD